MSHWGYVIEQLINEDEKSQRARALRRKRRLAGKAARTLSPEDGVGAQRTTGRRLTWPRLAAK